MVFPQMKEASQCRQFDEMRTGDGMVGQVIFTKSHHKSCMGWLLTPQFVTRTIIWQSNLTSLVLALL